MNKHKNENTLAPKLRFPEFIDTNEWDEKPLGDISNRITEKNSDREIKNVFTNSAVNGIVDQRDFFDKDIADKSSLENYYVVENGDYVYNPRVSNVAPVGPISKNKTGKSGAMSPLYTVFRFFDTNNEFYEYYFKTGHWFNAIKKVSNTGARFDRMSITDSVFMKIPVLVPPPNEQQKIAACLSSLDDLITAERQKLEVLKEHKKGLLQNLFPSCLNHDSFDLHDGHDSKNQGNQENHKNQGSDNVPKLRFKEFESSGEWEVKKVGEICENLDSKRVPITSTQRDKGDIPYYGASGIVDYVKDYLFDETLLCISEDGANLIDRNYPIAFTISGKTWVNNHAHVLRFDNFNIHVLVEKYINLINIQDFLTGMAQPKLNRGNLDIIPIPLPKNPKEQQKIASTLSSLDELINAQGKKIEALQLHKKGLLQGLFPNVNKQNG